MRHFFKIKEKNVKIIYAIIPIVFLVIDYFLKWKILSPIWRFLRKSFGQFIAPVFIDLSTRPYLLLILVFVLFWLYFLHRRLKIVAGEFKENFKKGLVNWEFGGEGWTIERGEEGLELSVTNSGDGGITNFGLWDNFEFSFQCKIINRNVGWIVRAKDRVNYFMVQCNLEDIKNPKIRPHFRLGDDYWLIDERLLSLENPIKINDWFDVDIKVYGNTVNVFINDEHALHYFIPDPGRAVTKLPVTTTKIGSENVADDKKEDITKYIQEHKVTFSFPNGKVGFRCWGNEHAHFRKIKTFPLSRI